MKFWWSGEIEGDVFESYREAIKIVEVDLNRILEEVPLEDKAEKWAFIPIIRQEDTPLYNEVVKRSSRGKVLEFRLKIPHAEFLAASPRQRISLILKALSRSVTLMEKIGVLPETRTKLQEALAKVEKKLLVPN